MTIAIVLTVINGLGGGLIIWDALRDKTKPILVPESTITLSSDTEGMV